MALTDSLRILITANGAQAEREFAKTGAAARRGLGQAETSAQRYGRTLTSAGVAMASFGAVALVGLYKAAQAADAENRAILQLQNSIANSPALVGASTDAFLEQAAALQDTTMFADDATISAQAMLATFRLTQDQITELTPLVQDLAAKFDVDLTTAATAVGKAMAGNTGTLRRWGVFIEDGATATEDFDNLLAGLRENAGGFAAQEGQTMAGQLEILKNNLGDVAEGIGQGVIGAFNDLLGPVMAVSDAFTELNPSTQDTVGRVLAFGSAGLVAAGGISFLAGQVLTAVERFKAFRAAALTAAPEILAVAAAIGAVVAVASQLQDRGLNLDVDELLGPLADGATVGEIEQVARALALLGDQDQITDVLGGLDPNNASRLADELLRLGVSADVVNGALLDVLSSGAGTAAAIGEVGDAASVTEEAISELSQEISDYLDQALGIGDAQDELASSFNSLYEQLLTGPRAFQGNTQAAIDNRAALDEIVRGTANLIDVQQQQGAGEQQLAATKRNSIRRIQEAARSHLIEAGAAREAIRAIRGIPPRASFNLSMTADNSQALTSIQQVYEKAQEAARAVGQIGGSLAGGGTYNPPGPPPRSGGESGGGTRESGGLTEAGIGRAVARELARTPQPVYSLNGAA